MSERARYTREALYELVWQEPPSKLARRFGLSDVGFAKVCRRLQVPLPGRGYWQRRAAGQRMAYPALPAYRGTEPAWVELNVLSDEEMANTAESARADDFKAERAAGVNVEVPATVEQLSKQGARTLTRLRKTRVGERALATVHGNGVYAISASHEQAERACRLMDALVLACKAQGMKVNCSRQPQERMLIIVPGESFGIRLDERVTRSDRELTDAERRERAKHPDRWYRHDYVFTPIGDLSLRIVDAPYGTRSEWKDGKRKRLEERLGEIVAALPALAELVQQRRAEREAQKRRWEEEQHRRHLLRQEIEAEEKRVGALYAQADAWHKSRLLRRYIAAVRRKEEAAGASIITESAIGRWLEWAAEQADRLDPTAPSPPSVVDQKSSFPGCHW